MKRKQARQTRPSALPNIMPNPAHPCRRGGEIDDSCLGEVSVGLQVRLAQERHSRMLLFGADAQLVRSPQAETILGLMTALHAKDAYTARHSIRVESYARCIAKRLELKPERTKIIRLAALLHDIGKIGISDAILNKKGRLTNAEFNAMKEHPAIGAFILEPIGFLDPVLPLVLHHHEWFDGTGYPAGLSAESIPFGAKVIQAADCVDAMMWPRSYKGGFPISKIITELEEGIETQFDPHVAQVTIDWLHEYPALMRSQFARDAGYAMT